MVDRVVRVFGVRNLSNLEDQMVATEAEEEIDGSFSPIVHGRVLGAPTDEVGTAAVVVPSRRAVLL